MSYKVGFISLGCAKNLTNSEQMLYLVKKAGMEINGDLAGSDVVIINTCGFIDSAKSEAIDNILEMAELKKQGLIKKIIVAGCLAQRYKEEIFDSLPEVDGLVGNGSFQDVVEVIRAVMKGAWRPALFGDISAPEPECRRIVTTGPGWAYVKIAEGCDNRCSLSINCFCYILCSQTCLFKLY